MHGLLWIGVWLAEALTRHANPAKFGQTWSGPRIVYPFGIDPLIAFDRVFPAVRLAVMVEASIDDEIADMRAGKLPSCAAPLAKRVSNLAAADVDAARLADKVRKISVEIPGEAVGTPERAESLMSDLNVRLGEVCGDAAFYRLLNGPLKDAVAAICTILVRDQTGANGPSTASRHPQAARLRSGASFWPPKATPARPELPTNATKRRRRPTMGMARDVSSGDQAGAGRTAANRRRPTAIRARRYCLPAHAPGDLVTISIPIGLGQSRPALIIQSNPFDRTGALTIRLVSGMLVDDPLIRKTPSPENGLRKPSQVMVDKAMSIKRDKIGSVISQLDNATMLVAPRSLALFLGMA